MRKKPVQIIGTTLAATALVGGSAAAATAADFGHHGSAAFDAHPSLGGQSTFGGHGTLDGRTFGGHGTFDARRPTDLHAPDLHAPAGGPAASAPSLEHRFARPLHHLEHQFHGQQLTFQQRQAQIVAALTAADSRLTALQSALANAASNDPTGGAAKALSFITQARTRVESLLAQVQAASTQQQLEAVLAQLKDSAPQLPPLPSGSSLPPVPGT